MTVTIVALLTALAIINAVSLVFTIAHYDDRKSERHTMSTDACFLDGLAVQHDVVKYFDIEEAYHESELTKIRAAKARALKTAEILREGRTSPHSYNPDQPAGRRPKGME